MEIKESYEQSLQKEKERCEGLGIEMPTAISYHQLSGVPAGVSECPKCKVWTCSFDPNPCKGCGYVNGADDVTNQNNMTLNINSKIKVVGNTNNISDGYHTFGELYEHRIQLFIALCKLQRDYNLDCTHCGKYMNGGVWRAKKHNDGSVWEGWFILGLGEDEGKQITYHLPISKWDECDFAETLETAPPWDGHTSDDVLRRLKEL